MPSNLFGGIGEQEKAGKHRLEIEKDAVMADPALKRKIWDVLRIGYFKNEDDYVYVTDGDWYDCIHVLVVSPRFVDQHMGEKMDLIWSKFSGGLSPEEWGWLTLSIGVSPEELMVL